jgi:hypothetical protein
MNVDVRFGPIGDKLARAGLLATCLCGHDDLLLSASGSHCSNIYDNSLWLKMLSFA